MQTNNKPQTKNDDQHATKHINVAQVKVCGLTRVENALECTTLGVDAIGCVFYPKSPRHVTDEQARNICQVVASKVATVGVFVNESFSFIMKKVERCMLDTVQLHGQESPELVARLRKEKLTVIKTLFLRSMPAFENAKNYRPTAFLVECGIGALPGGNAVLWNWEKARQLAENFPVILAGGLSPENVSNAVSQSTAEAVDVSSGVEYSPGLKNPIRVKAFVQAVSMCGLERKTRRIF
ncbi:MAG: phosphoribosylanthranilate isomerase [Deltaproteobacteria bacterium]|nr:phosphoribosylanthranilate isomerase [Deltaproteobacteria bacterium]